MKIDSESQLELLAADMTKDWTGAELAHVLVKEAVIRALSESSDTLKIARMCDDTKGFTPMVRQKAFAEDIAAMEEACAQFTRIGNMHEAATIPTKPANTKSRRQTTI